MIIDEAFTHNGTNFPEATLLPATPSDWTSPNNYANGGNLYVRFEVTSTQSNIDKLAQLCMWRDDPNYAGNNSPYETETCAGTIPISTTGVYWADLGDPSSWWVLPVPDPNNPPPATITPWAWNIPPDVVGFHTKPATNPLVILQDAECNPAAPPVGNCLSLIHI